VSLPIFSFLPLAVYPLSVTTYWCYFSWIVVYNFVTIYGNENKFGIRKQPYSTYQCTKFPGSKIMIFVITFTPWQKEEKWKKIKEISQFLKVHILETPGTIFLKFGSWGDNNGRHYRCKNHLISLKFHGATYNYVKITLLFFLLITRGCVTGFLGHTTHYCVS